MKEETFDFINSKVFMLQVLRIVSEIAQERRKLIADSRIQEEICSPGSLPGEAGEERRSEKEEI